MNSLSKERQIVSKRVFTHTLFTY